MIKLVVSDMDGTLLNKQSQISDKNLNAILSLKQNNIEFAIASGRDYQGVCSLLNKYHITCESILGNGAQYCDKDGHILMSCYLNKKVYQDIVMIFEEKKIPYMVFTTKGFFTGHHPDFVRHAFIERAIRRFHNKVSDYDEGGRFALAPCNHLQYIDNIEEFLKKDLEIIKVEAFSLNVADIPPAKKLLADIPTISYLSSFDDNVEVTDQNAQKGLILEKVIEQKGYTKEEVAVLGDGMNDLTLFQCFPYSFAPANAVTEIQELAYKIVKNCEEDGFAEAIYMIREDLGN